jgi:hypothetical protein
VIRHRSRFFNQRLNICLSDSTFNKKTFRIQAKYGLSPMVNFVESADVFSCFLSARASLDSHQVLHRSTVGRPNFKPSPHRTLPFRTFAFFVYRFYGKAFTVPNRLPFKMAKPRTESFKRNFMLIFYYKPLTVP